MTLIIKELKIANNRIKTLGLIWVNYYHSYYRNLKIPLHFVCNIMKENYSWS